MRTESTGRGDGYVVFSEPAGGSTADDGAWIRQGYLVILCIGNEESVVEQRPRPSCQESDELEDLSIGMLNLAFRCFCRRIAEAAVT